MHDNENSCDKTIKTPKNKTIKTVGTDIFPKTPKLSGCDYLVLPLPLKPTSLNLHFPPKNKRIMTLSFVNTAKSSWPVIQILEVGSFEKNSKGTIIKGNILPNKGSDYDKSNKIFKLNDVKGETYIPGKFPPHLGEI